MQQNPAVTEERVYIGDRERERHDRISSTSISTSNKTNNPSKNTSDLSMEQMMERRDSPVDDAHSPKKFKSGSEIENCNRAVHVPPILMSMFLHEGGQDHQQRQQQDLSNHQQQQNYDHDHHEPFQYHEQQNHYRERDQHEQQHPQHNEYHHQQEQHNQYHGNAEERHYSPHLRSDRSQSLTPPPRRARSYQPHRNDDQYARPPPRRTRSDRIHQAYHPHHQQHHNPRHHPNPLPPVPSHMGSSSTSVSSTSAFQSLPQRSHYEPSSGGGRHHPPVPPPREYRRPVSYVCASSRKCYPSTTLGKRIRDEVKSMTDGTSLVPASPAVHYREGEPEIPRGMVPDHRSSSDSNYHHHHRRPSHNKTIRLLDSTKEILDVHSILGRGTFSVVSAITIKEPKQDQKQGTPKRCPRYYACKSIKEELLVSNVARMGKRSRDRGETYLQSVEYCVLAASQLAYEAHILSCLDHPNIVKMRGLDADGLLGFEKRDHRGFFLLMDVLTETLDQKIDRWRSEKALTAAAKRRRNHHHNRNHIDPDGVMLRRHKEKLDICLQLALALEYLHERRVVFRDLKPSNVGFISDSNAAAPDRVQLFDFGLSRELTPDTPTLRGAIGTMRYMAPEVCLESTYDCDCDIYSYAVVCWEIWTQKVPFEDVATPDLYREQVCQMGYRPVYRPEDEGFEQRHSQSYDPRYPTPHQGRHPPVQAVPNEILLLLSQAWKPDPKARIRWPKTRHQLNLLKTLVDLQLEERQLSESTTANAHGNPYKNAYAHRFGSAPSFDHHEGYGRHHAENFAGHHHQPHRTTHDHDTVSIDNDDDNHSHFELREEDLREDLGI